MPISCIDNGYLSCLVVVKSQKSQKDLKELLVDDQFKAIFDATHKMKTHAT